MTDVRPTLGDVAREAGVHKATASRALNPMTVDRVNPGTVDRVQAAALRLGYRPNLHARGLRTRRSNTVGVLLPDTVNPIYAPIVRGIETVLAVRNYTALVINTDLDPKREVSAIDQLQERQVDGFITGTSAPGFDLATALQASGVPVVTILRDDNERSRRAVIIEHQRGAEQVVDHLVGLGHEAIAYLTAPLAEEDPRERASAFSGAIERHGLSAAMCPVHHSVDLSATSARRATLELLTERPDLTAVVAHNDWMAVGVLRAATILGRACPDDLSIVGFNDLPFVAELSPPLTTVHFPADAIGISAAELLLDAFAGNEMPIRRRMSMPLVVRQSTARPRSARTAAV